MGQGLGVHLKQQSPKTDGQELLVFPDFHIVIKQKSLKNYSNYLKVETRISPITCCYLHKTLTIISIIGNSLPLFYTETSNILKVIGLFCLVYVSNITHAVRLSEPQWSV